VRGRLLPEPALGQAGAVRPGLMQDLGALEGLAVAAAVAAGRFVVDERPAGLAAAGTKSSPTDVVTLMDTGAEDLLRAMILASRPDDAILGEEGEDRGGTSGVTWVLDPIDGTVNYLYGIPAYAVSVAAVVGDPRAPGRWEVLAGAVCDPSQRRVYHARRGGGARVSTMEAHLEGTLSVGSATDLGQALVGTGFGYREATRRGQAETLTRVLPAVRDIRRIGSAALDLCAVAGGRLDGYYEQGLNPWDLAAGWLLVAEAGGVVTGPGSGPPSAELTVAANRALHGQLLALVGTPAPGWQDRPG